MSDLVKRLREQDRKLRRTATVLGMQLGVLDDLLYEEAAAEIERLRAEAERYRCIRDHIRALHDVAEERLEGFGRDDGD